MTKTNRQPVSASREGLTLSKVFRFLSLPFSPGKLRTWLSVERLQDVPIEILLQEGIRGIILDADGTLCPNNSRDFPTSVIRHVRRMLDSGLKVAIYTNASEDRFQAFSGVEIVTSVEAKPDPRGFETAMKRNLNLEDPAEICMIGDNYITDGGAISLGMKFIHVHPVKGQENPVHRITRFLAYLCARFYYPGAFRKKIPPSPYSEKPPR